MRDFYMEITFHFGSSLLCSSEVRIFDAGNRRSGASFSSYDLTCEKSPIHETLVLNGLWKKTEKAGVNIQNINSQLKEKETVGFLE